MTIRRKQFLIAAKTGNLDKIKELYYEKQTLPKNIMKICCQNGHVSIVKWLHFNCKNVHVTTEAIDWAAYNGHLEVIVFLSAERNEGFTEHATYTACEKGYTEIVDFLYNNANKQSVLHPRICLEIASNSGHINIVKIICKHLSETDNMSLAISLAKSKGYKEIVEFLQNYTKN